MKSRTWTVIAALIVAYFAALFVRDPAEHAAVGVGIAMFVLTMGTLYFALLLAGVWAPWKR